MGRHAIGLALQRIVDRADLEPRPDLGRLEVFAARA
jgi:hypothetical protein